MSAASASAPGKLMWSGEYAVLDGHVAVLSAIGRRVVARFGDQPSSSPLIRCLAEVLSERDPTAGARAATIEVDSSALFSGEHKLGLGSSAAVAAAAAALALGDGTPDAVLPLAFEAHGRAQAARGARGSGADIAAAVHGGLVAVRVAGTRPLDVMPLRLPDALEVVMVWTGVSADTAALVAAVSNARSGSAGSAGEAAIAAIAAASRRLIDGLRGADISACIDAVHRGADAHLALAQATGVELITPAHRTIRALAASRGGAAKPTGAGGGDVALAVFPDAACAGRFREDLALAGLEPLEIPISAPGVAVEGGPAE